MRKYFALLPLVVLLACEKGLIEPSPANTPQQNFEVLSETIEARYSFLALKKLNWDSIHSAFSSRIIPNMSDEALFTELDSMLFLLEDGHVNLVSPFNLGRNWNWYLNYPDNFNYEIVERHYLGAKHRRSGGFQYTILADSIGYLYYPSFSSSFSEGQLDVILSYLGDTKGLILDLRHNGGGSLNNSLRLASRFYKQEATALLQEEKTGPGPNDFGNRFGYKISPSKGVNYTKPIVVLTNRRCYSATNTFMALLKTQDHIYQLGDQTGGGGGIPADFELPNGWRFRFSVTRSLLPNGYDIELGLVPDEKMDLDPALFLQGQDELIERAKALLD